MEKNDKILNAVKLVENSISQLEKSLIPLFEKGIKRLFEPSSSKEDCLTKINNLKDFVYILISIVFSYLKCSGIPTDKHEIMFEIEKLKKYTNKLKANKTNKSKIDLVHEKNENSCSENVIRDETIEKNKTSKRNIISSAISSSNFKKQHI